MDEGDRNVGASRRLVRLAREPLLHFAAIGAALFVLFAVVGRDPAVGERRIVVTRGTVAHLASVFERTRQRPPSPAELEGLVADHVREEILVREAVALGLDRDDVIVRRRLRQKLELLAEGLGRDAEPRDQELARFLARHADRYRVEPRITFQQLYLDRDRRGAAAEADAVRLLARLRAGEGEAARLADALPLPAALRDVPLSEVGSRFGEPFAARLAELPLDEWSGPIESGYGPHLVLVEARSDGRPPALDEVREAVLRDWQAAQAQAAVDGLVRSLREGYEVTVEEPVEAPGAARAEPAP